MSCTQTWFGPVGGQLHEQAAGGSSYGRVRINGARHERAGLLVPQVVSFEHPADASAAHGVALGRHFGAESARAVALAVVPKCFAHRHLSSGLGRRQLSTALLGVICCQVHAQHLTELAHGSLGPPMGNILVDTYHVGWPRMTIVFLKISSSHSAHLKRAHRARTSDVTDHFSLSISAKSFACYQR